MRTLLAAIFIQATLLLAPGADIRTPPPITFSVQPEEDGKLVYLPVVAQTPSDQPSHLFGLRVTVQNNDTNEVRLTNIRINFTYADNAIFSRQFSRDLAIAGTGSLEEYLTPEESIQFPKTAPVSAEIQLFCDGYALPKTVTRSLAAYQAPGPSGKYQFPGSESDLPPDVYWSHKDPHSGGGQFFGYDLRVVGWNGSEFASVKPGGDSSNNEHYHGWGIPVYAMEDGVVIRARTGFEDNPTAGSRVIQRMDEYTGSAISDVKITRLADRRMASVVRLPSKTIEVTAWDVNDSGRELIQKGSDQGEAVDAISVDALSSTRLITAVRTDAGNLRVIGWDVATNSATVNRRGSQEAGAVKEVSIFRLASDRFATAVQNTDDTLRLIVWQDDGLTFSKLSETNAGVASSISTVALSGTRLATTLRTSGGALKVIVWELLDDGATIDRRGEVTADDITAAVSVRLSGSQLDTAMRTAAGDLKVIRWAISGDGETVTKEREVSAGQIQGVAMMSPGFDDAVVTSVITESGTLKHILWEPDTATSFNRWGEEEAGGLDRLSIDQVEGGTFLSAVRLGNGDLKLIAWWIGSGGGNSLVILHGDVRMLYAHFRDGSANSAIAFPGATVKAGQYLGRMGNSGSSSGPHTHIHADRNAPFLTVEEIIALDEAGGVPSLGPRPIPFHCARAKRLSAVAPGENPASTFSTMQGHGAYFTEYAIRPTWFKEMYVDWASDCLLPTGRKQCTPLGLFSLGGPYPTVNQALASPACSIDQLFIRTGTYDENVTFSRPMTVRSYDGTAVIR